jgi:hypothetical protein
MRGRHDIPQPRGTTEGDSFESPANRDVHSDESRKTPSAEQLCRNACQATTQRTTAEKRRGTPRSRNRFGNRQTRTHACPASGAAASADQTERRYNCEGSFAARCGHKNQSAAGAADETGQASAD